ncbi:MAG: hypothetical protein SGJ20_17615 [Planctomycetota bacterium]|nr:hypothetical protein [Planctomycetota bacterium]
MKLSPQADSIEQRGLSLPEGELGNWVHRILTAMYPHGLAQDRRRDVRYPYPHLIYITAVGDDDCPMEESLVVTGKHLSEGGLSFYHPEPISYRRVIASLDTGNGKFLGILLDLCWCRFTRQGWYESGGRFIRIVQSPVRSGG